MRRKRVPKKFGTLFVCVQDKTPPKELANAEKKSFFAQRNQHNRYEQIQGD